MIPRFAIPSFITSLEKMFIFGFLIVLLLILCASMFSAIETAFTACSPARLHKAKLAGDKRANLVLQLIKIKSNVISTFLILYSIVITIATTIATSIYIQAYGDEIGALMASLTMALVIIVFAEVIPKAIAVAKADNICLKTCYIVNFLMWIFKPLNHILSYFVVLFCYLFKINLSNTISASDEVRGIIEQHHSEGNVYKDDKDMLDGILGIRDMEICEIMIHRSQMCTIDISLPISEIVSKAISVPYNRIPMWKDNKDNIISILNVRSLLKALSAAQFDISRIKIEDFTHEPWFIPDNVSVNQQLNAFRSKRLHMAVVVDEYGCLMGLVTIEDILEEIVGSIYDEKDQNLISPIQKDPDCGYIVNGSVTIRDINRELEWHLPDEHAHTIAGLIMYHVEEIPEQGDQFSLYNLNVTILKKVRNKIITIILKPKEGNETENDGLCDG